MSPAKSLDEIAAEITSLREEVERLTIPTIMVAPVTAADPDTGTVTIAGVEGVEIPTVYVPEVDHLLPVIMNGLSPIVFPPAGPPVSAAPDALGAPSAVGTVAGLLVEWDAAPDANVRWNKGYYELQWDTVNTFDSPASSMTTAATAAVLQDLTPGVLIYVRVRAVNYAGTPGAWSTAGSGTPIEVDADLIAAGSITSTEIANDAITTPKLATGAVTAVKITAATITSTQIAAATIVAGNIAAGTITATQIAAGTITATEIQSATITTTQIAAGTILATNIAAATITGTQIAATTIAAGNIAANTITAGQIAAGTITATQIAAGTITATKLSTLTLGVGKYIRSTSYTAGSVGWIVNADGTAEFNNLSVRGLAQLSDGGTEILTNPGFETNNTDGWTDVAADFASITNVTTAPRTGSRHLQLTFSGGHNTGSVKKTVTGLTVGRTYRFSVWVKPSAAGGNGIAQLFVSDLTDVYYGTGVYQTVNSGAWQKVQTSFTAEATSHELHLLWFATSGAATLYVDDQSLKEASQIVAGEYRTASDGTGIVIGQSHISSKTLDSSGVLKDGWTLRSFNAGDAVVLHTGTSASPTNSIQMGVFGVVIGDTTGFGIDLSAGTGPIYLAGSTVYINDKVSSDYGGTYYGTPTSWTPVLASTGTNPVLGTGGTSVGAITRIGKRVFATMNIHMGSGGGFTAGTGTYTVTLPSHANSTWYGSRHSIGTWTIRDGTSGTVYSGQVRLGAGGGTVILNISTGGAVTASATGGGTWTSTTDFELTVEYFEA